jgi:K+-sensing histidine kinase KdpD
MYYLHGDVSEGLKHEIAAGSQLPAEWPVRQTSDPRTQRVDSRLSSAVGAIALALSPPQKCGSASATRPSSVFYLLIVLLWRRCPRLCGGRTSALALLTLNYFFMPPVGTLTLEDPQNWVALVVFLAVSVVASRLSLVARSRADEALARRDELARLFDLSRDILLTTESREAIGELARHMARRFGLDYVGICLPERRMASARIERHGNARPAELDRPWSACGALEFDALTRSYGGQRSSTTPEGVADLWCRCAWACAPSACWRPPAGPSSGAR